MQIASAFIHCTAQHIEVCWFHFRQTRAAEDKPADMYECRLWNTNESRLVGECCFYYMRYFIAVTRSANYAMFQYVLAEKEKSISTFSHWFCFYLKSSLRHFGLLEQTIKDTLSRANHHNLEQPQVFTLRETSLTISHVKQLLAHVTFSPLSLSFNNVAPG